MGHKEPSDSKISNFEKKYGLKKGAIRHEDRGKTRIKKQDGEK